VTSLKYPPPLGKKNGVKEEIKSNDKNSVYPDIIASLYDSIHEKLIVIYSDKTFLAWEMNNNNIHLYRSKIFHCGGIKAMDYYTDKENNIIKIATCSDDKTVIFWNIPIDEFIPNQITNNKNDHIFYSQYIKHIFFFGNNFEAFKIKQQEFLSNSYSLSGYKKVNNDTENEEDDEYHLTSIRFSPCGNYIIIGDTFGNIQIFSLIDFKQINKIDAHNGEINSLDMINFQDKQKIYLSSGSSDNLVSLIDMSEGLDTNPKADDKTIMEKMSSPVISVVFCIDKYRRLKLIVGEQNSTITFFQIVNGILQTLQKNFDEKLKTYCLSYSPSIKKIISGHNGKITIWKTSTNIAHKHFQVNKGDKILDNFRIASDSSGLMFATSNDDKVIRVRALHDGKLLSKIQVSESISSLFFILEDNYLIATSIEGYLFFFK
jgi:WD40 repeat protein